jgi:MarR family transcriptional regulator, organic hydroperoxide resistance regulator
VDIRLQDHLCFKLYVSSRLIVQLFSDAMSSLGLTYPKYLVLVALCETNNQTVGELGKALHLDSGTLSPLLKSLVADGYIVRARAVTDERIVSNSITDKGRSVRTRATAASYQVFCSTGASGKDLKAMRLAMDKFILQCEAARSVQGAVKTLKKPKIQKNNIATKNAKKKEKKNA